MSAAVRAGRDRSRAAAGRESAAPAPPAAATAAPSPAEPSPHDRARLLTEACEAWRARRRRDQVFDARLFAEPSWDILLDLFIAGLAGREVSVSSACLASPAPATTALRHIGQLVDSGLVARRRSQHDARVTYLELTPLAIDKLAALFGE